MNPTLMGDTIAAISTPLGMGGIGIVRISGPRARPIAEGLFRRRERNGAPLVSHRFYLGEIVRPRDQVVLDEVLLVFMQQPKTYTREDVVEIQCHSGLLILQEILQTVLENGARLAEPGEFTKRAFLLGRIDLTQAEAVIDLIQSRSRRSLEIANFYRAGKLAEEIRAVREGFLELLASFEASIDFPEEDIPELPAEEILRRVRGLQDRLNKLLGSYEEGKIVREGIAAVIAGKPNVGKSSLLNSFLQEERAIVTPIPGTTRDVIEEIIQVDGIPLRLMDTAGLRPAQDLIEEEGLRRTRDRLQQADLTIWVVDGSAPLTAEDFHILSLLEGKRTVVAVNKNDLPAQWAPTDLHRHLPEAPILSISALRGTGIDQLKRSIRSLVLHGAMDSSAEILISNIRHKRALEEARSAAVQIAEGLKADRSPELITLDIQQALEALGEIVGETTSEEVLNRIFSQFCIGK
jgi:tRNA modification GTPase